MKKSLVLLLLLLIMLLSQACSYKSSINCPPTPVVEKTVEAAVAFTCGALLAGQDEESASGNKIINNVPAMLPELATPEPAAQPYETMAQVALGTLLSERLQQAGKAASIAAVQSSEASADGEVTQRELELLYTYWSYAVEMKTYAEEPLAVYKNLYADLSVPMNPVLLNMETNLATITQQINSMYTVLEQLGQVLWEGKTPADTQQLKAIADAIQTRAVDLQGQGLTWITNLPSEVQARVDQALAVKPKSVPKTRKAAINRSYDYFNAVRAALKDNKITQDELAKIAQLGATAAAGLTKLKTEKFINLANQVKEITAQIAGGQMQAAQASLDAFKLALPKKPK